MTTERYVRTIAGTFVLISLALWKWVNPNWIWFTVFVGANLFQSGITGWCLMSDILKKLGVGSGTCCGDKAEKPDTARVRYDEVLDAFRATGLPVASGVFQAHMHVASVNDGPVTILLDRTRLF